MKTEGEQIAVEDPAEFAAQIFRTLLIKRGIDVLGTSRGRHVVASDEPAFPEPGGGAQTSQQNPAGGGRPAAQQQGAPQQGPDTSAQAEKPPNPPKPIDAGKADRGKVAYQRF